MAEFKRKNKKKIAMIAIMVVALIVLAGCGAYIYNYYEAREAARIAYEEMQQQKQMQEQRMQSEETEEVVQEDLALENSASSQEKQVEIPVDFATLQAQNPDIYAWISIPGTVIDYPILQSAQDNSYYLNHTVDKVEGLPGSIYTENLNAKDFSDNNTVIYGHNMRDGSMFAELHKYSDNLFFQENSYINIYTPKQALKYQIFAAYISDDKHILKTFDLSDKVIYQNYLDEIFSMRNMNAFVNKDLGITSENKMITLSTCNSVSDQRWIVQAVLIEEE